MAYDLRTIGHALRNIREKKGLTVEQVSHVLPIEKRFIEGIESGDWKSLPEPFFVKGYVSHYIAFLDIADRLQPGVVAGKITPSGSKQKQGASSVEAAVMMGLPECSENPLECLARSASRR